jgi:hypothetical protein
MYYGITYSREKKAKNYRITSFRFPFSELVKIMPIG